MPGRLTGRVVVVTGAASGIGAAISVAFAQEGAQVALVDLAEPVAAEPVLAAVRGHDRQAVYVQTDVADEQAVSEMARSVLAHFGRVDVLANNAGHAYPVCSAPADGLADSWTSAPKGTGDVSASPRRRRGAKRLRSTGHGNAV